MDRGKLLENRNKKNKSDRVPLVLTFSKLLPDIRNILRKHQATLHKSERMREVFDKPPLLAFRRDKNLCDVLVHRKTDKILGQKEENCACDVCESIIKDTISDTKGEKSYSVVKDVTCKDRNLRTVLVVYLSVPFLLKSSYTLLRIMLETVCIPPLTSLICEIKTRGLISWKYQVILVIEYVFIIKGINYAL